MKVIAFGGSTLMKVNTFGGKFLKGNCFWRSIL